MTEQEIYDQLTVVMRRIFKSDTLIATPEVTARNVKGWDSLQHIRFVLECEKAFSVKFKTLEISAFKNLGDLQKMISTKLAARQ